MDEQLYFLGSGLSLDEKVEKAIANFREYEAEALRHDPVNGYYLCDSFGKDSGVILRLAQMSGVRFKAHHNLTTLDPPELIHFGIKHHPDTVIHRPKRPMLRAMVDGTRGPPTRLVRWCCEDYKEQGGAGMVRIFGVRAAESARRKANWKVWTPHRIDNAWVLNPILYWTDDDVWTFTKSRGVPYCSLYDEGFTRLGCIGCPMSPASRLVCFYRWPRYERAWKRAVSAWWQKWSGTLTKHGKTRWLDGERRDGQGRKFNTADELWKWWMEGMNGEDADDCQMGLF
jgi:phosphoadenosine phosphosulfate reductase